MKQFKLTQLICSKSVEQCSSCECAFAASHILRCDLKVCFIQTDPQSTFQAEEIQDHPSTEALRDALIHPQTQAIVICHRVRKIWRDDEAGSTFDDCSSNEQEVKGAENGEQVFLGKYQDFHRGSRGCTLRGGQEKRVN